MRILSKNQNLFGYKLWKNTNFVKEPVKKNVNFVKGLHKKANFKVKLEKLEFCQNIEGKHEFHQKIVKINPNLVKRS